MTLHRIFTRQLHPSLDHPKAKRSDYISYIDLSQVESIDTPFHNGAPADLCLLRMRSGTIHIVEWSNDLPELVAEALRDARIVYQGGARLA